MPDKISANRYPVNRESNAKEDYYIGVGIGDTIRTLRQNRKMTQAALVKAVKDRGGDLSQPQLSAIERNEVERPGALVEIALALGTTSEMLLTRAPNEIAQPTSRSRELHPPDARVTVPFRTEMERTLPILGVVSGGAGGLAQMDNGTAHGFALRPAKLDGRTDVAAFWVEDPSAGEAHPPGSLVVVEKRRPPQVGEWAIFELLPEGPRGDRLALIKRFAGKTATHYKFEQLNPKKSLQYPQKRVANMMRVIPLSELLGA